MPVTRVVMPKLSEAMEAGKVIKWLKREGDRVQGGDIVAEVETDKADVEMEAFGAGVIRKILVPAGAEVPVGALIAVIAEPGDDISALVDGASKDMGGSRRPPSPPRSASRETRDAPRVPQPLAGSGRAPSLPPSERPGKAGTLLDTPAGPPSPPLSARLGEPAARLDDQTPPGRPGRVKASPLARKIAAQWGVDLALIDGSGPGGRIVRRDVEAAAASAPATPAAAEPVADFEDLSLSPVRATIAKRMPLAKGPVPHFYVTSEVAMDRAWGLREELNALEGQPKVSVNDLVVRACALALMLHPGINAAFQGDHIRLYRRAHVGIAVALDDGLITPVLRDCQAKSLARIAEESRDLTERARARKLRASELSGATFSISNLGMYGVAEFSAIINPPEGAILAVGAVRRVPVVEAAGGLGVGRRMMLTLSCDHRVMDGSMAARFLQDLKRLLEEPLRLLA